MMTASPSPDSASAGARLDDLLASRFLPRGWATRIWSACDLPRRLEHCARSLSSNTEWRAYGAEDHIFFAIAREHLSAPHAEPSAAIDVYFLDDKAAVYSAGVWEHDLKHGWWLDSVLDLSYDCEHGWWLEGLMDAKTSLHPAAVAQRPPVEHRPLTLIPSARPTT
jgi:hypothetical protein